MSLPLSYCLKSLHWGSPLSLFSFMASRSKDHEFTAHLVHSAREALIKKGLYLGSSDVSSQLVWQRNGKLHQYLATVEDVEKVSAHNEALDPITSQTQYPPYAILSAIVFIPSEDYWLTSCGMWKAEHKYPFAKVKPTCTGQAPKHPVVSEDFRNVLSNMDILVNRAKGSPSFKGALVNSPSTGTRKLKFRHILFEVCLHVSLLLLLYFTHPKPSLSTKERKIWVLLIVSPERFPTRLINQGPPMTVYILLHKHQRSPTYSIPRHVTSRVHNQRMARTIRTRKAG